MSGYSTHISVAISHLQNLLWQYKQLKSKDEKEDFLRKNPEILKENRDEFLKGNSWPDETKQLDDAGNIVGLKDKRISHLGNLGQTKEDRDDIENDLAHKVELKVLNQLISNHNFTEYKNHILNSAFSPDKISVEKYIDDFITSGSENKTFDVFSKGALLHLITDALMLKFNVFYFKNNFCPNSDKTLYEWLTEQKKVIVTKSNGSKIDGWSNSVYCGYSYETKVVLDSWKEKKGDSSEIKYFKKLANKYFPDSYKNTVFERVEPVVPFAVTVGLINFLGSLDLNKIKDNLPEFEEWTNSDRFYYDLIEFALNNNQSTDNVKSGKQMLGYNYDIGSLKNDFKFAMDYFANDNNEINNF